MTMKNLIFFFFLFIAAPMFSQTYLIDVTDQGGGEYELEICDATNGTQGMTCKKWVLTLSELETALYQRIENSYADIAKREASAFSRKLLAKQIVDSVSVLSLNYQTGWANTRFGNAYDGNYVFETWDGTGTVQVYISGTDVNRSSDDANLATVTPHTVNAFFVTRLGVTWKMVDMGFAWVGEKPDGTIVTLKSN